MRLFSIIGGPGAWKTTLATALFSEGKQIPFDLELSCERARHSIAQARFKGLTDFGTAFQAQVAEDQLLQDQALASGGPGMVIADSSAALALLYSDPSHPDYARVQAAAVAAGQLTHYVVWSRVAGRPPAADENRIHDYEQCLEFDRRIEKEILPLFPAVAAGRFMTLDQDFDLRRRHLNRYLLGVYFEGE